MLDEDALNIYTDGSSFSGPRTGGIGIVFVIVNSAGDEEVINEFEYPGYRQATNNEMELEACIKGLQEALDQDALRQFNRIIVHTDSRYVVDNYQSAMFSWPKTQWCNRETRRPILHVEQWKRLVKLLKRGHHDRRSISVEWLKGHSKDKYNKAADKLARKSAKNPLHKPLSIVSVRRKRTSTAVKIGSVEMRGQRLFVRIITTEYLATQKLWKYHYEVLSEKSRYAGNADIAFSSESLRDGHCYEVVLNHDTKNPRITRMLGELECPKLAQLIEE
jgi:ribonuclease HI